MASVFSRNAECNIRVAKKYASLTFKDVVIGSVSTIMRQHLWPWMTFSKLGNVSYGKMKWGIIFKQNTRQKTMYYKVKSTGKKYY